jgi:hypothetical protein
MANEISFSYDSSFVLYAFVYRQSDKYIYDVSDSAFEVLGTWNDARAISCSIAMTASGDMHFADFPIVEAGAYFVQIRLRSGASASVNDVPVAQGFMVWDGIQEFTNMYLSENNNMDITPLIQSVNALKNSSSIVKNVSDETNKNVELFVIKNL